MQFDYDPLKSQLNQSKHGIDFEKAKMLWKDSYRVEITAKSTDEDRFMIIGKIDAIAIFKIVRTELNENGHSITIRKPSQKILLVDGIKCISDSLI